MAAQADNKKGVAGIMRAKGKKIASDRNGLAGMSSRCTWPPGEHLSFYIRACKCGRFRPSLRDLILVWRLIPGLKAWAIFKSPSGTNRKVRCARRGVYARQRSAFRLRRCFVVLHASSLYVALLLYALGFRDSLGK